MSIIIDDSQLEAIANKVYSFNDAAHKPDHWKEVHNEYVNVVVPFIKERINEERFAIFKNSTEDLFETIKLSILAHDAFAIVRKEHHLLAGIFTQMLCETFKVTENRNVLAAAAVEHRASGSSIVTSILSEVVATADRGKPSIENVIVRAVDYSLEVNKQSLEITYALAFTHIKEKFSRYGYMKNVPLWEEIYKDELEEFYDEVENLTIAGLKAYYLAHCKESTDVTGNNSINKKSYIYPKLDNYYILLAYLSNFDTFIDKNVIINVLNKVYDGDLVDILVSNKISSVRGTDNGRSNYTEINLVFKNNGQYTVKTSLERLILNKEPYFQTYLKYLIVT